jgi:hypothetical protein
MRVISLHLKFVEHSLRIKGDFMIWFFNKNRILVPRNLVALLILYFGLVILTSCAYSNTTVLDSAEGRYLAARTEFNNTLSRYLLYKSNAPVETQVEWEDSVEPIFQDGSIILDTWGMALKLKNIQYIEGREMEFLEVKNRLIDAIANNKIFK